MTRPEQSSSSDPRRAKAYLLMCVIGVALLLGAGSNGPWAFHSIGALSHAAVLVAYAIHWDTLAVGLMLGVAFGAVVTSFTNDIVKLDTDKDGTLSPKDLRDGRKKVGDVTVHAINKFKASMVGNRWSGAK